MRLNEGMVSLGIGSRLMVTSHLKVYTAQNEMRLFSGFRTCIFPRCLRIWLTLLIFSALSLILLGSISFNWPLRIRSTYYGSKAGLANRNVNRIGMVRVNGYPPPVSLEEKLEIPPPAKGEAENRQTDNTISLREIENRENEFYVITKPPQLKKKIQQGSKQMCLEEFEYETKILQPKTPTKYSNWSFQEKHKCLNLDINTTNSTTRPKIMLSCDNGKPRLYKTFTSSSDDVMTVQDKDPCLKAYIQNCCRGNRVVPNVANYVWVGAREVGFFHFVSFMSALRFTKPCLFLFHGTLPRGVYWDYFITLAPNVVLVNKTAVKEVYGKKLKFVEHSADVMRIEALIEFGGYYLDWDEILLRSVDDFRDYNCTMSQTIPNLLTIGFIMGEMNATYLNLWHQGYKDYRPGWAYNSLRVSYNISRRRPDTVHIAGYRFVRPSFREMGKIFFRNYNWTDNYGIHLYIRYYKRPTNPQVIRTLNTTIGAVCRHVLFGDKELCTE